MKKPFRKQVDKRIRSLIIQDPRISGRADFTTVHWMVIIILTFEMLWFEGKFLNNIRKNLSVSLGFQSHPSSGDDGCQIGDGPQQAALFREKIF